MTDQQHKVISNGTVVTPYDELKGGVVVIEGSRILDVGRRGDIVVPPGAETIDAGGANIVPGLIDIHVHGSNGADVMDATPGALETMSRAGGVPDAAITLVIATGTHRAMTSEEIAVKYGPRVAQRVQVINHDCLDEGNLVSCGTTRRGTLPVYRP